MFLASATAKVFPWGYGITTNTGMNNPYYDDKLFHYGFFLGMNFMGYGVTESLQPIGGEIYHARVSTITPGFRVGLIVDMRLAKYLNLRFTPGLDFATRAIRFKNESGNPFPANNPHDVHMLSLPIDAPILLKYSAQRVGNYRPYVIGGGEYSTISRVIRSVPYCRSLLMGM